MSDFLLQCFEDKMVITMENYKHFVDYAISYPDTEIVEDEFNRTLSLLEKGPIGITYNGFVYGELTLERFKQLLIDLKIVSI